MVTNSPARLRIAVTGGSGKLGSSVVGRLRSEGHQVLVLDREGTRGAGYTQVDLTDYGQIVDALLGVTGRNYGLDALVHLAAIPSNGDVPDVTVFHHNLTATFNLFWAARRAGILRIVYASSLQAMGAPFVGQFQPRRLPLDETHGGPSNTYGLVKMVEESIAEQLVAWDSGLSMTGLRFARVVAPDEYPRLARTPDPSLRDGLGAYVDSRDAAQAVSLALASATAGHRVFAIAAPESNVDTPTAEVAARWFPGVPVDPALGGFDALVSTAKARRELGFVAAHDWRTELGAASATEV